MYFLSDMKKEISSSASFLVSNHGKACICLSSLKYFDLGDEIFLCKIILCSFM